MPVKIYGGCKSKGGTYPSSKRLGGIARKVYGGLNSQIAYPIGDGEGEVIEKPDDDTTDKTYPVGGDSSEAEKKEKQ